jgi:thiamine transport system ATP-binding protein
VATLFQDQNLFPHLSLAQNVALGVNPNLRLAAEDWTRVSRALDRVGLSGLAARRPRELSGGQQSRAALARVILQSRDVLLLDEPFSALGPALKSDMLDLVKSICSSEGMTLLMVTHDPDDALQLCAEAILVADGRAHPPRDTRDLITDPPASLRAYLGTRDWGQ